ncbi:MAG: J domain-containing protein [Verrucomicrobium sp.]|nr:J domain-containing protein [Verrucomicrobium sp.]
MPVQFRDYYKTLGVSKTASEDEIKSAFRKLARKYHPDVAKDKTAAEEKFKEINEAYEVLGDAEKRRKYDQLGADWDQPGGGVPPRYHYARPGQGGGAEHFEFNFGGTGFSDFFEAFFGRAGGGMPGGFGRGGAQFHPERGEDIEGDILVTLEEAMRGSTRPVTVRRTDPRTGAETTQTFQVRIPPGIREGQRIRLAGQGDAGSGGAGDLYLNVRLARHPDFRVSGDDLYYELPLAPWEAVLGASVTVPTLEGTAALRIPPGAGAGQKLRLRGQGLPKREGKRGDLYAVLAIEVPTKVDEAEQALWQQLAERSSFRPRD